MTEPLCVRSGAVGPLCAGAALGFQDVPLTSASLQANVLAMADTERPQTDDKGGGAVQRRS